MNVSLQDLRGVLNGQMRADEAIFWFCYMWNTGPQSDLYRAMCLTGYDPRFYKLRKSPESGKQLNPTTEPELQYCYMLLDEYLKHPRAQWPLMPIRFDEIKEEDVVVHGPGRPFVCIPADWPCKVYKHHGDLGVPCAEDGQGRSFHPFKPDALGNILGFRR